MAPNRRILSVLGALLIVGVAWRLDIIAGIGVVILAIPFPKGMAFGTTNLALVPLLLVIYMLRVGQRELPRPRGTSLDMPIIGLVIAYAVSFYNVLPENLGLAIANFEVFLATLLLFVVVSNSVRSEADLRRLHQFQVWTLVPFSLLAFWELAHPGGALVPGWIDFSGTVGDVFNSKNVRIRSTFNDYELLAEFSGLNIIFLTFLLMRTRELYQRLLYGSLLAATVFIMFSTVTRGPIFSFAAALAYLMWLMRRRLKVVPVTVGAAAIAATLMVANFIVSNFTRSGDLFARLSGTEIHGLVPETRTAAWASAWEHFLLHPLIGCGPHYSSARGLYTWYWPHDLYLYVANITGIVGFTFFMWLLWKLFVITRPRVDTPAAESYTESYLLIARVQLVFFLVDQTKIEYLRNNTYQYEVWLLFALWAAADRIRREAPAVVAAPAPASAALPWAPPAGLSPGVRTP
jgi:O-antigen ligase